MQLFAIGFSQAMGAEQAARELAEGVEKELGAGGPVAGGMLWATAAAGNQGAAVGRLLAGRWPGASLLGTSFEGILADGRWIADRPAMALLAWAEGGGQEAPGLVAFEAGEDDPAHLSHGLLDVVGRSSLGPRDLLLLFPDAHAAVAPEPLLHDLAPLLGNPTVVGAAASGLDAGAALAWVGEEQWPGALVGLVVPGPSAPEASSARRRVSAAGATRGAGPWLRVTRSRSHWIDQLEGENALTRLRRELRLDESESIEPHLDRLLMRLRHRPPEAGEPPAQNADFDERYVVGIDAPRGSICLPIPVLPGDEVAFALPDAELARRALRQSLEALPQTPCLLHFICRARDAALHGDAELEPALVAHLAVARRVVGAVAPFQITSRPDGEVRLLVHASLLVALGPEYRDGGPL